MSVSTYCWAADVTCFHPSHFRSMSVYQRIILEDVEKVQEIIGLHADDSNGGGVGARFAVVFQG